jgi:nucleotide-binding universal stress UspA family protein
MPKVTETKKTFSKILVTMHKSSTSNDTAIDYAIKIAQDYDAQLVILNVIRADANLHNVNLPNHVISMKEEAQAHFIKIIEKIHENSDKENILRIKTEIVASVRIADAIISYAKDKDIDLIIIGTRDRSKLKSVLVGNVESNVVRSAHCPVLTVK